MKNLQLTLTLVFGVSMLMAQDLPKLDWDEINKQKPFEVTELYKQVPVVTPGATPADAPSDALVLFDGSNMDAFRKAQFGSPVNMEGFEAMFPMLKPDYPGDPCGWKIDNKELVVVPGTGNIQTKKSFGDIQIHVEWLAPRQEGKVGQAYSNTGVIFMGAYEVQTLNGDNNPTYSNGQVGSVYKQHIPLANASKPVDNWQIYDIVFMAPKFSDKGTVVSPAKVTVFHNGVLIQNGVELLGPTCYIGTPYYVPHAAKLPLVLQDHGDPMRFRNIWVREL